MIGYCFLAGFLLIGAVSAVGLFWFSRRNELPDVTRALGEPITGGAAPQPAATADVVVIASFDHARDEISRLLQTNRALVIHAREKLAEAQAARREADTLREQIRTSYEERAAMAEEIKRLRAVIDRRSYAPFDPAL
jgi:hypothetical protein